MAKAILSGLFAVSLTALAAHAAPATQAEADRLKALFERYVGTPAAGEPSSVTVIPEGTSYRTSLDIRRALRALEVYKVTLDDAVADLVLTPQDDGTWHVSSQAFPPLVIHVGPQTTRMLSGSYKFDGTFDPKVEAFVDATTSQDGTTLDQEAPNLTQHQRVAQTILVQKGSVADAPEVSLDAHYALTGVTDDVVSTPPAPPAADAPGDAPPPAPTPMSFSYQLPSLVADLGASKLHMKDLFEIWAFFVAHPDRPSIVAAQEELRGLLRSALPFADGLGEKVAADQFALTTPLGPFSARRIAVDLGLADLPATGKASLGLTFDGLVVPTATLPVWSLGLIPGFIDFKTVVTGFHFGDAAKQTVEAFDLKAGGLPPEQRDRIGQVLWPSEGGKVVLSPSRLTSALLDLRIDGEALIRAAAPPTGRLTVQSIGLDKVIPVLQDAAGSDPMAAQLLTQVVAAKNIAKPGPDGSLIWAIAASSDGAITVNDVPMK